MDLEEFLKAIPKAELHVHLTGSVFRKNPRGTSPKASCQITGISVH